MHRTLRRIVDVRPGETAALAWAFAYFFALLSAYYVLRPVRDAMGVAGGVEEMPWLFTATFVVMLVAVPAYAALVSRWPRRRFVPWVYHVFAANLLVFHVLMHADVAPAWTARAFFVWVSVFNLFVVSVFWSLLADLFRSEQGARLFGAVAAGGTAGALAGPALTSLLAEQLGTATLLLVSLALVEAAVVCVHALVRCAPARRGTPGGTPGGGEDRTASGAGADHDADGAPPDDSRSEQPIGGTVLGGLARLVRSPYLLGVAGWIGGLTLTATFLYFQQATIVEAAFAGDAARTAFFARIDLATNVGTLVVQAGLTGRLLTRLGPGPLLALLPLLTAAGFVALGAAPVVGVLATVQALRRASNYALARPARELLFTVVPREDKYKAKAAIDTVVYRGGDAVSGWLYAGVGALGVGVAGSAFLVAPVALLWAGLGLGLGRSYRRCRSLDRGETSR